MLTAFCLREVAVQNDTHIKMSAAWSDGNKMFQAHTNQLNLFVLLGKCIEKKVDC